MRSRPFAVPVLVAGLALASGPPAAAAYVLPGTAGPGDYLSAGAYAGGTVLDITAAASIELVGGTGFTWRTYADGSLDGRVTFPAYLYANPGAGGYPTPFGGDGVNHFAGGGANYDTAPNAPNGRFGFAGAETTDTLDPGVVRFGAVVGTFSPSPTRADWFYVGVGTSVTVPSGGGTLSLAVSDSNNTNNLGAYSVEVRASVVAVPEPASASLLALGAPAVLWYARRHKRVPGGV